VIIGIIAAITVPMLIQNHKRVEASTRIKKFYSTMSNALRLAEIEQGIQAVYWDYTGDAKSDFEKYFGKYISCTWRKANEKELDYDSSMIIEDTGKYDLCVLNDGTYFDIFSHKTNGNSEVGGMYFLFDYNGDKGKNISGRDQFSFSIGYAGPTPLEKEYFCQGFSPTGLDGCRDAAAGYPRDGNFGEGALSNCKSDSSNCTYLLYLDSWEFKDDYPYRI